MKASEIIAKLSEEFLKTCDDYPSDNREIEVYRHGIKDGLRRAFVHVKLAEIEEEGKE